MQVLPDENDCVKLFKAVRISKYVAQENIVPLPYPRRCTHRVLPNYFEGYDPVTGRHAASASVLPFQRCPNRCPQSDVTASPCNAEQYGPQTCLRCQVFAQLPRVMTRGLLVSRYVPNAQLAFEYPDDSYGELGAAAPLGSDGNLLMRDDPMSQVLTRCMAAGVYVHALCCSTALN